MDDRNDSEIMSDMSGDDYDEMSLDPEEREERMPEMEVSESLKNEMTLLKADVQRLKIAVEFAQFSAQDMLYDLDVTGQGFQQIINARGINDRVIATTLDFVTKMMEYSKTLVLSVNISIHKGEE
jgi:predicted RNA methylase